VTTLFLRSVPKGTNGGMSFLGTLASLLGGLFIGFLFYFLSFILSPVDPKISQFPMVYVGGICGVLGSLFDSLLGALLQATYYSNDRKMIVKRSEYVENKDKSIVLISGRDILTNEQVNAVSIVLTMICSVWIGRLFF
jgi:uncharacterized membrane protein